MLAAYPDHPQDCRAEDAEIKLKHREFGEEKMRAVRLALPLMTRALDLLDGAGVSPEVATPLQAAISEASQLLNTPNSDD
jgi:hypothetical protein